MLSELKKLRDDTLKNPAGKYSRKSVTTFIWVSLSIFTGIHIVITIPEQAINVFFGYLGLSGGVLGMTIVDKIKNGKEAHTEQENEN